MAISWSAMRKKLEKENLCAALQGRIQYFATRYRQTHDNEGGVALRVDGKEVFRSDFFDWVRVMYTERPKQEVEERSWQGLNMDSNEKGAFDQFGFYKAFYEYDNQSIEKSLVSDDAIVRLFAILDKRTGKRTLESILPMTTQQPEWLRYFYRLRMDAEGIGKHE